MPKGHELGLISNELLASLGIKEEAIKRATKYLEETLIAPQKVNELLHRKGLSMTSEHEKLSQILKRPTVNIVDLSLLVPNESIRECLSNHEIGEQVEIDIKYEGYIKREIEQIEKFSKYEVYEIPEDFDYLGIKSISSEGKERLHKVRPRSIGQAARISGVTNSDISVLTVFLRR
jgi:tRNA uridine 5-carboxymethylaminomethyl modification enzyme